MRLGRRLVIVGVIAAVVGVGAAAVADARVAATQQAALPAGVVDVAGVVLADPAVERFGSAVVVDVVAMSGAGEAARSVDDVRLVLRSGKAQASPGDIVLAAGVVIRAAPGWHSGRPITGAASAERIEIIGHHAPLYIVAGNALRKRVLTSLRSRQSQAEALTTGFLIGDISQLGDLEQEELRRSGLTHFVAVSGGNVALFLAGVWILLIPFRTSPQIRSLVGLLALIIFVVVTRWEPSVVRAAAMAALVLLGRIVGFPVDPWRALGGGVAAVLILAPELAGSAGFHLSVAATTGLLLTSGLAPQRRPRWLWIGLTASTAAQVAVMPLLLLYFDQVPLLAPLANVIAAPLVSLSMIAAGVGALAGLPWLVDGGVLVAGAVLRIAGVASQGPQLAVLGVVVAVATITAVVFAKTRPMGLAIALVVTAVSAGSSSVLPADSVVVLDVGQGDAIVIRGADGTTVGVDTGPDPVTYQTALRRVGVSGLDLLVITHGDADHIGGASGLFERVPVGALWLPAHVVPVGAVLGLIDDATAHGVPVRSPPVGVVLQIGGIETEVLGPMRRYDAENDGSIVLWLRGPRRTMLVAGDIEAVAQRELPPLSPDVMVVPHHGSATTDPAWLAFTLGSVAIISVGDNSFGHPAPQTTAVLDESGVVVLTTQEDGDVFVSLG